MLPSNRVRVQFVVVVVVVVHWEGSFGSDLSIYLCMLSF